VEEFLGILFAGGRGTRLGSITQYISKAFVPVYDRPVFLYPLAQLRASRHISEIVILTNTENDAQLRGLGCRTIVQDDAQVHDMFSGLRFVRSLMQTDRHFVLMPCDNISDLQVDSTIAAFLESQAGLCFNLTRVDGKDKLRQMGVFDPRTRQMAYKPEQPPSEWGVIAPYVVRNTLEIPENAGDEFINKTAFVYYEHPGYWFDIGDVASLLAASQFVSTALHPVF
jgi:dTDP-glucose pyrophosphorylase